MAFDGKKLVFSHYGERGNFSNTSLPIELTSEGVGKPINVIVLSKDILPLLSGLVDVDLKGKVTVLVGEGFIALSYQTELASYKVYVPTCSANGKRNNSIFETYGG